MSDIRLATKYHLPPPRANVVPRQRLIRQLDRSEGYKLTLISAPAGFGKTTLIRAWVEAYRYPRGWLSLDEQDNSPSRFLAYLIHTFQTIDKNIGGMALELLQGGYQPQPHTVLTHLIHDLTMINKPCALILDDYHLITNPTIHSALDFLIAHLPTHVCLIMASRNQPPLKLARLRSQAQLLELTTADLRFTAPEVEQFFSEVMPLPLSAADRARLEMRTEGWIAGLQLAALAMQNQTVAQLPVASQEIGRLSASPDPTAFVVTFSGTDRFIGDYLFEEVLQQQPSEIQMFLLYTSILDHLSAPLCEALLPVETFSPGSGQTILTYLDQHNLFTVPLDHQREWYRYHHLFGEMLRHRLSQTQPEQLPLLHQRAGTWFEQQGWFDRAIHHRLAAKDYTSAADLIEVAFQKRDWIQHDMHRLLAWFEALPSAVTQARPQLELAYAWLRFEIFADDWDWLEPYLYRIEQTLIAPPVSLSLTDEEVAKMLASVDLLRANQARQAADPQRVIALCEQALHRLPQDETYLRSGIIAHLATAYEDSGDMAQASQTFSQSIRLCRAADNVDGLLFATARLIEVLLLRGQLRQAEAYFEQVREYEAQRTGPDMGQIYLSMAEVYRQKNELQPAKVYLEKGLALCRPYKAWQTAVTVGVARLAQVLAAEGHYPEALTLLREAEQPLAPPTSIEQAYLQATCIRLWLQQGDFAAVMRRVKQCGFAMGTDLDDRSEIEQLTRARLLIAQAALQAEGIEALSISEDPLAEADDLLRQLYQAAKVGGREGRIIEILTLQALHAAGQQAINQALTYLEQALTLAEPEGYVWLFVEEGQPLYRLLTLLSAKPTLSVSTDYIHTLLAVFPADTRQAHPPVNLPGSTLTKRELKTLQLLATDYSIEAIAAEMSISVSSVRTYTKRIYSKLDAHSRAEAVYRAKMLRLL